MKREITGLKVDHLEEAFKRRKIVDAYDGTNVLHMLARNGSIFIDEEMIRELIRRGADVNGRDIFDETPLGAAALGSRWFLCEIFLKCGARDSAEKIFKSLLLQQEPRPIFHVKKMFAFRWADEKRTKRLITGLLCVKAMHVLRIEKKNVVPFHLPLELQARILTCFDEDCIPTHCLSRFVSRSQKKKITKRRLKEAQDLVIEFNRWMI